MTKLAVRTLVVGLTALLSGLFSPLASAAPSGLAAAAPDWLRLTIESLAPSVVTASDTSVTMMGKITNISDRRISDVKSRIQIGDALNSGTAIPAALRPTASFTHSNTDFSPVTDALDPGQSVDFTVSQQLQGPDSLRVDEPGVYPLMINVQGVPAYGSTARLVAGTMLLPVLAPPGGQQPAPGPPSHLTVLWPLVDQAPRMLGSLDGRPVLADDSLATSLAPGGRLFGLLDAVRQDQDPTLLSSLCFAVDPDLLDTVRAMATGYRVQVSGDRTVAGAGTAAAVAWLGQLKTLTQGHCVLVLPYADADVTALAHAEGTTLLQLALSQAGTVAAELGAQPMTNVAWPADGTLDTTTMSALAGLGVNTVLLDADSVQPPAVSAPVALAGFTGGDAPKVLPIDPVATTAMDAAATQPNVDGTGVATQDGLAATIYQTVFDSGSNSGVNTGTGGSLLIAPPRRWAPPEAEAAAFLDAARTVLADHYATPTSLTDAVRATPTGPAATLTYPLPQSTAEVPHHIAVSAVRLDGEERDVQNSMTKDHTTPTPVLPTQLITPLRQDLLRSVSSAWRDGDTAGATAALANASAQFEALTASVQVVQPSLPLLLGSKNSRVPVTVNNRLPVDVSIRVDLTGDPGLPSGATEEDVIPAGASVTVFIPTSVTRSGRLSAYATVRTLGGTQLGQQARLELVSSAYGTIVVIVTAIAFGLLVLLSGRRIYRRVRASRVAATTVAPDQRAVGALVGADRRTSEQQERNER